MKREFSVAGVRHGHIVGAARRLAELGWHCVGVADEDPQLARPLASELDTDYLEDTTGFITSRPAPLVLTAEVNGSKWEIVTAALRAGSHVLADKPLATTIDQIERICTESTLAGKNVWVLFTIRYNGFARALKRLVDAGELGEVVSVEAARPHRLNPDSRPDWMFRPDDYGGVLNDLACHDMDMYLWLGGKVPQWVRAEERSTRFRDLDRGRIADFGAAMMGGGEAPAGYFRADWLTPGEYPQHGDCRLRVVGTEGTAELFYAGEPSASGEACLVAYSDREPPHKLKAEPVERSLETELAAHLEHGEAMTLSPEDCIRSSTLAVFARQSVLTGETFTISPGRI